MSSTEPHSEETLFATALALPEAARAAYLDQACSGDATVRASVEALLRAHLAANRFLPSVSGISGPEVAMGPRAEEQPGNWIGRYKLLQKIAEGGCGIVYMAEQKEPIRRRVALKVIKLGMDTSAVVARFEAERQALAMMDHPNIAKVLDAGSTDSGRPFFVMELVRGIAVTKYCDEQGLATDQRLDLFSRICTALQHAHQKGIIHRDIKPSNILVTLHDGVPVPKVIDFGIAKATQGKLTDQTYFTAFEQFVGTPAYMSPEQAEMSGLDIDTRSDIYSLGVLLYELLAGRPPFDPQAFLAAGLDEMRRLIREVDPPKPSARLSTLAEADRTTVAKQRGTAPAQLSTELAGDLDWIVMRCLEKDRTRRYATPSELVADIERHLRNEPVIARPPSTGYLLQKLIRRHRLGFAAGTAVAVSIIAGLLVSTMLLVREQRARVRAVAAEATESRLRREAEQARAEADANATQAREEAAKSAQVAQFMTDMLKGVGPSKALGMDTKLLRRILDATRGRLETELRAQPAVAAALRDALGAVYIELAEFKTAEPLLRDAVATHRAVSGDRSPAVAVSLTLWGQALRRLNQSTEAEAVLQEALAIRREFFGGDDPLVADTLSQLAQVPHPGRNAAEILEEVLAIRRKAFGTDHTAVATTLFELGEVARQQVDHENAIRRHEEALAMRRRLLGNEHPDTAASLDKLGYLYAHELDRKTDAAAVYAESFDLRRRLLGDAHPNTVVSLLRLIGQTPARDASPEMLDVVREFVTSHRKRGSALLGPLLLVLTSIEDRSRGDPDATRAQTQEARLILQQSRADGAPLEAEVVDAMWFFAWSKFIANAPAEGLAMGEEAWKLAPAAFGPTSMRTMLSSHTLAWLYMSLGRHDEAAGKFEDALKRTKRSAGFPLTPVDMAALGACYRATHRLAESHEFLQTKLASLEAAPGDDGIRPQVALVRGQLGLTLLREGLFAQAETMLRRSLAGYDDPGLRPLHLRLHPRQQAMSGLGQALAGQGKFAEAEPLVVQAFQELQANEHRIAGDRAGMVREARDAMLALYTAWGKPEKIAEWTANLGEPSARSR
jgi:serine/threonine protein kinase/tetratricopeptide (TPR) repeat protein